MLTAALFCVDTRAAYTQFCLNGDNLNLLILLNIIAQDSFKYFYPRDAMLARVFATAKCLSVRPSVRPSHVGIVPSRAKAGS